MNKRKAKKEQKKVVYPLVDEFNLLFLKEDDYNKAIKDYKNYCFKFYRYKHYKEKEKIIQKLIKCPCLYSFPFPTFDWYDI